MSDHALGRILDPRVLDEGPGARGRVRIALPAEWLVAGCRIDFVVPRRLPCARCDGGGCDGCSRSGVLLAPDLEASRHVAITLPGTHETAVALRLTDPFGCGPVAQLIVEIRAGVPSPGVTRRPDPPPAPDVARAMPWRGVILAAVTTAAAILLAVLSR